MDPVLAALLALNNYCHDIATAMLMASGIIMWVILRRLGNTASPEIKSLMFSLYAGISKIVTFSLIWLAAGAVPRILTFSAFEFADARAKDHLPGLMAKHLSAFAMILGGAYLWISLIRRIKEIRGRA
jgi:hypothetical protein